MGYGGVGYKLFEKFSGFVKPQILIGKEFQPNARRKSFIQLNEEEFIKFSGKRRNIPSLTVSYGIKF